MHRRSRKMESCPYKQVWVGLYTAECPRCRAIKERCRKWVEGTRGILTPAFLFRKFEFPSYPGCTFSRRT